MAAAAAAASPVASKAASAFEAVVASKSSAAASPFSALASASGLGAYETIQSPSELAKPPGFQKRGGRRSSLRVSDLMTFTPDQSLRPEGPPRSVRRSTRLSGVKKDYKV